MEYFWLILSFFLGTNPPLTKKSIWITLIQNVNTTMFFFSRLDDFNIQQSLHRDRGARFVCDY